MTRKTMKLASPGKRFAAAVIDAVPMWIIGYIAIRSIIKAMDPYTMFYNDFYYGYNAGRYGSPMESTVLFILVAAYVGCEMFFMSRSQTIGKAIMGLRVIRADNGTPIGLGLMIFREVIVKIASESAFCLGYIWILIDERGRGWHDKILETYVIDARHTEMIARQTEEQ